MEFLLEYIGGNTMIEIKEVMFSNEKSKICNNILKALPNWFGIESSIIEYVKNVKIMPFYVAYNNEEPIGFIAIKEHNPFTSEIFVMGILDEYHRQGIGKKLIEYSEEKCRENKTEFLTVKTLAALRENESYEKTRLFYHALGFKPLEVFPLLWNESNPCLFLAKIIKFDVNVN